MYIIFDENIPYKIPEAIKLLDMNALYYEVHTTRDLNLNGCKDIELFPRLRELANIKKKKCIFITGDVRIFKRSPEIQSFKNNDIIAFVCPPSYGNKPMWERSAYMIGCWKSIIEKAEHAKKKEVYLLPVYSGLLNVNKIKRK